jgi:hypothetical protein
MSLNDRGLRALGAGDYQEAVNIFKRCLEKRRDAVAWLGLARAYDGLGEPKSARWAYYQVLELDARNTEALTAIKKLEQAALQPPTRSPRSECRSAEEFFEVLHEGRWTKIFFKAINIGLGLPGYFPGEYAIGRHTYETWFRQISELGMNAIRIYTVHPPSFYEAFRQFNESGKRLYLFQGIWSELPKDDDFNSGPYLLAVQESIRQAVDVVYGNAGIPERPGHASGDFGHDVSRYTAGFIFGREWESCAVRGFNESFGRRPGDYEGAFLQIAQGTPFEVWLTKTCDFLQSYEYEKYGVSHPVSAVNWPTLDPLDHPSESTYEDEMLFQGRRVAADTCSENEDMESVDFTKMTTRKGGGVFATYHVYPYYPDFMNNDYQKEENPYLSYLQALKRHHGRQSILIAEFGVPSSRDISHWQKNGWHHGGHSEARQGEINGLLMRSVYKAKMAGGVLFSWFDEWFKRSWVFSPYEIPAERKPFWYNIQDAEQNYGIMAAYPGYPGKKVTLSGRGAEWSDSTVLYEKKGIALFSPFNDGFDDSRLLTGLAAQHDEGFLYIMLKTNGMIDFSHAHYLIGLDTCSSAAGEFALPFKTNFRCPVGLQFLIHLAGESKSRILVCQSYDKYLNAEMGEIKPVDSVQGAWVIMQNKTNNRRISKNKETFYPAQVCSMSRLRYGSLDPLNPRSDSLSDFFVHENLIELRIPWGLINITDPSSRRILWTDGKDLTRKTEGIRILAVSYKPEQGFLHAADTGKQCNITDSLPEHMTGDAIRAYTWEEYDTPVYHTYLKKSYELFKNVLSTIPEIPR